MVIRRLLTHPSLEWLLVFVPASIVADLVGQPILVFITSGLAIDIRLEIAVVSLATVIVALIALEGRSNWLSGFQLVGAYILIATAGFFIKSAA